MCGVKVFGQQININHSCAEYFNTHLAITNHLIISISFFKLNGNKNVCFLSLDVDPAVIQQAFFLVVVLRVLPPELPP